ncbi:hypothetical protein LUZ60_012194 [Juncus effusus]|nr:hypothetical protein LUZ60_012194 [Juncus effusus]
MVGNKVSLWLAHIDLKSAESYIPTIAGLELEKQFHSVYTHAKVREFQEQFVGTLACVWVEKKADDVFSEYEVEEMITYGEEKWEKVMTFLVIFNSETNESICNCRLFEFRGIVCKHQLVVWKHKRVQRVPDKYVLRRWRKDVIRAHTKIRIRYENSSRTIEEIRYDEMRKTSDEVADLAKDSEEKFEEFMDVHRKLKEKYLLSPIVAGSNTGTDTGSLNDSYALGEEPSKENPVILDPESIKPKGRPRNKRFIGKGDNS